MDGVLHSVDRVVYLVSRIHSGGRVHLVGGVQLVGGVYSVDRVHLVNRIVHSVGSN